MKYYIISEEDLKDFIRTSKRYGFACECMFYRPSEKELEVTEENLKRFKELNEYIKEHSISITDKKYEGMKAVSNCTKNCASEEFMRTFNELKDDYSGPTIGDSDDTEGGYYDINEDFKEIIEKLKKLDINISNLIQIYDNHRIEGKDYDLVYYTRLHIKKCIKNIESLSFLRDKD